MRFWFPLLMVMLLAFGWSSASAATSRHKNYAADARTVYMAARDSLIHHHFQIASGSLSEGKIEAYRLSNGTGGSRRLSMSVRIRDGFSGGSDLVLQMSEVAADDSGNPVPSAKPGAPSDKSVADDIFQGVEDELSSMRR